MFKSAGFSNKNSLNYDDFKTMMKEFKVTKLLISFIANSKVKSKGIFMGIHMGEKQLTNITLQGDFLAIGLDCKGARQNYLWTTTNLATIQSLAANAIEERHRYIIQEIRLLRLHAEHR